MDTARHLMPRRPRALRSSLPMWAREKKDTRLEYRLYSSAGPGQAWAVRVQVDAAASRASVFTELLKARDELRGMKAPRLTPTRAEDVVDIRSVSPLPAAPVAAAPVPEPDVGAHDGVLPTDLAQLALF